MSYKLETYEPVVSTQPTISTQKNWAVGGTMSVTGTMTVSGVATFLQGVVSGTNTFINQYLGNYAPVSSTDGTDTTPVAGSVYYGAVLMPTTSSVTGLSYLVGSIGATGNVIVSIYNPITGALIASSALAGTAVGTAATLQRVPFTAPVTLPGTQIYYVAVQFSTTAPRFRTIAFGDIPAAVVAGSFGTLPSITPVTTFTANAGPICALY